MIGLKQEVLEGQEQGVLEGGDQGVLEGPGLVQQELAEQELKLVLLRSHSGGQGSAQQGKGWIPARAGAFKILSHPEFQ